MNNPLMNVSWLSKFRTLLSGKQRSTHFVGGLPDNIPQDTFHDVVRRFAKDEMVSTAYKHISGWKSTGAFRIKVKLKSGKIWKVIFKDADYDRQEIPALEGLPIIPGPPEYWIYKSGNISLKKFLPRVYSCEQRAENLHFNYFLEDLQPNYKTIRKHEIPEVCGFLPYLHKDMTRTLKTTTRGKLLDYDLDFSKSILEYSYQNLKILDRIDGAAHSTQILRTWKTIEKQYLSNMDFAYSETCPLVIHGDSNRTNILIHRSNRSDVRFIDWEWAGLGLPHMDLASFLKNVSPETEASALKHFSKNFADNNEKADIRIYLWCKLQRALFDAGFFAKQELFHSQEKKGRLDNHIVKACSRASQASSALSTLKA